MTNSSFSIEELRSVLDNSHGELDIEETLGILADYIDDPIVTKSIYRQIEKVTKMSNTIIAQDTKLTQLGIAINQMSLILQRGNDV